MLLTYQNRFFYIKKEVFFYSGFQGPCSLLYKSVGSKGKLTTENEVNTGFYLSM